jgi:hypothetical protein
MNISPDNCFLNYVNSRYSNLINTTNNHVWKLALDGNEGITMNAFSPELDVIALNTGKGNFLTKHVLANLNIENESSQKIILLRQTNKYTFSDMIKNDSLSNVLTNPSSNTQKTASLSSIKLYQPPMQNKGNWLSNRMRQLFQTLPTNLKPFFKKYWLHLVGTLGVAGATLYVAKNWSTIMPKLKMWYDRMIRQRRMVPGI